ncbi:MAG: hypothetical protein AAGM36_06495 [Cyanobacteria bacterium J06597_1]
MDKEFYCWTLHSLESQATDYGLSFGLESEAVLYGSSSGLIAFSIESNLGCASSCSYDTYGCTGQINRVMDKFAIEHFRAI